MKKVTIESLLENQDFINWVKNPNKESNLYWKKWIEENPDKVKDIKVARQLIRDIGFNSAFASINDLDSDDIGFESVLSNILKEQKSGSYIKIRKAKTNLKIVRLGLSMAASFVVALVIAYFMKYSDGQHVSKNPEEVIAEMTKVAPFGQKLTFKLSDNTVVVLNSGSEVRFPSSFNGEFRDIKLKGEAFFEVAKNKDQPFRVLTNSIQIKAIGTSFNVRAYENEKLQEVALQTGIVEVKTTQMSEILAPGEIVVIDNLDESFRTSEFNPDETLGWKDGILFFDQSNLDDFKSKIEKWYGVEVEIKGLADTKTKISGYFKNETLENVLQSLKYTTDINYQIDKDKVILILN